MKIIPFLLALGLAVGGTVAPAVWAADTTVDDGAVSVTAAPAFSGLLRPGQALQVNGVVSNTTSQAMDAGTATVFLSRTPVPSRSAMTTWLDPAEDSAGTAPGTSLGSTLIGELAPGQVRPFTITIPAPALGLSVQALAAYPLTVRLASGTVELDVARSAVVLSPGQSGPTTRLAIAMPIITPSGTTGLISAEDLTTYTAPSGLLTTQLTAALSHPVAIGIDPMILASIRILGTSAPQSALYWLARLAGAQNETFALSYADSDLALAHQAGEQAPLVPLTFPIDPSLFAPVTTETPVPAETPPAEPSPQLPTPESLVEWAYSTDGLAWPNDDTVVEADLDAFASIGFTRTILSSSQLSGITGPNGTVGKHAVTVSDAAISGYLRAAANAPTELAWQSAMTSVAAELAASATSGGSLLLATLGRDGSTTGPRLNETLDALSTLPWMQPTTLDSVIAGPTVAVKLVAAPEPPTRVATASALLASERQVTAFSSVLVDPPALTGPRRLALLATLAQSWHTDQAGWNQAADQYRASGGVILDAVRIPDSSPINFPLEKGNLPIAVKNELDFPVTVYVTVQPERAILDVVDSRVELTIEANSQAKAQIPVQSIANGQVLTKVSLSSATNVAISQPTFVELNVQAGWETAATVVLAVIVIALFVAGVWRTVSRRRKLKRESGKASG